MQQVKDSALSLQQLSLLLWHRFDSWSGNVYMLWEWPKKKKEKKKKKTIMGKEFPTAERGEYMENIKEKKRNIQDRLRRTKCWRMYLGFVLISRVRNADMEMTVMKEEVVVATDP